MTKKNIVSNSLLNLSFIALIVLVTYSIYHPLLKLFFAQDDFFLLAISKAKTLADVVAFFIPRPDTVWYRPLSQQLFFGSVQRIFGLSPSAFHAILFVTHIANIVLLFFSLKILFPSRAAIVGAFVYGLHPAHFLSLAWPAAFAFLLGPTVYLLTVHGYSVYLKTNEKKWYFWSLALFIFALFTTEVSVITPASLFLLLVLGREKIGNWEYRRELMRLIPYVSLSVILLLSRFVIFPPTHIGSPYQFNFGLNSLIVFRQYFLNILGMSENFRLAEPPLARLHITSVLVLSLFSALCFFDVVKKKKIDKDIQLSMGFITIGLFPFLLIPQHYSSHYLSYALIGIAMLAATISKKILHQAYVMIYFAVFCFVYIVVCWSAFMIQSKEHWIIHRANLAQKLINQGIYRVPAVSEEYFALGANFAEQAYEKK